MSPDGKFMWTGSEWIPAPPTSSSQSANMLLQDSVIGGDVNITQNNVEDITSAMVSALERIGFSGQSSPSELTPSQEKEVEEVLEISEQIARHGIEIDPWTEITLGQAAVLAGRTHTAQQHYLRALETFRKNGDRQGEAASLGDLGNIVQTRGDLAEAERLYRESLAIMREIGDRQGESYSLNNLGNIEQNRGDLAQAELLYRESLAIVREIGDRHGESISLNNLGLIVKTRGDLAQAERLYRESLAIVREIGDRQAEAISLNNLGEIAEIQGDLAQAERLYRESVRINREIGIPIDQFFIDRGY
jgi:tetratricopeptide (TPR) repeat protein